MISTWSMYFLYMLTNNIQRRIIISSYNDLISVAKKNRFIFSPANITGIYCKFSSIITNFFFFLKRFSMKFIRKFSRVIQWRNNDKTSEYLIINNGTSYLHRYSEGTAFNYIARSPKCPIKLDKFSISSTYILYIICSASSLYHRVLNVCRSENILSSKTVATSRVNSKKKKQYFSKIVII